MYSRETCNIVDMINESNNISEREKGTFSCLSFHNVQLNVCMVCAGEIRIGAVKCRCVSCG